MHQHGVESLVEYKRSAGKWGSGGLGDLPRVNSAIHSFRYKCDRTICTSIVF